MIINDNGIPREMTAEEIVALGADTVIAPAPTLEERLTAMEGALLEMLTGGVGNA